MNETELLSQISQTVTQICALQANCNDLVAVLIILAFAILAAVSLLAGEMAALCATVTMRFHRQEGKRRW